MGKPMPEDTHDLQWDGAIVAGAERRYRKDAT